MSNTPPQEVLFDFLHLLRVTINGFEESLFPVLRGSLLLRQWYGECARPAADIDLECFEDPKAQLYSDEELGYPREGFGLAGEFTTLVDFGKSMCRYAAEGSMYGPWQREQGYDPPAVEYLAVAPPEDGESLWVYGTPGARYYAGWVWHANGGQEGALRIDIAEPGSYSIEEIGVVDVTLTAPGDTTFTFPAYTLEMMLAAKLSWLVRSFVRQRSNGLLPPKWQGEPKDLFDVHLMLTKGSIDAEEFQRLLLVVGREDQLDWNNLEALFDVRRTRMTSEGFDNWKEFHQQHDKLLSCGPVEMLRTVCDHLEPLLGDFYRSDESGFLLTIGDDPIDQAGYLIYADWLEERGDNRCEFLRLYTTLNFHAEELSAEELPKVRGEMQEVLARTSEPWLQRLLGAARLRTFKERLDASGLFF
ncbi:MAG: nucleotidyl transferase AbiEii/AbiGii toxin family protein [Gemmataceae bacterium]